MVGWLGQARAEGKAEGKAEGRAEALLELLAVRRLEPTPDQRTHIESCRDTAQFKLWLRRVLSASTVGEILADDTRH
jgi:hypothetical protein